MRGTHLSLRLITIVSALTLACDGNLTQSPMGPLADMDSPDAQSPNQGDMAPSKDMGPTLSGCGIQPMFEKLAPTCGNCHRSGNSPYFASSVSFYNLLISDPAWVIPGDPDASELVAILKGTASGQYAQMPLGEQNFEQLAQAGQTQASLDDVRQFIIELKSCQPQATPTTEQPYVQRKSAQQIHRALKQHLGLVDDDIVRYGSGGNGNEERFPIWSPDNVKRLTSGDNIEANTIGAAQRWYSIGGESYLQGIKASRSLSPTFGQTITQVSQAWCRIAVTKPENHALFKHVPQGSTDATEAQIKANIRYLMLRFWGHVATTQEVDDHFTQVYSVYAQDSPVTGWIASCASLIRDPLWLVY